MVNESSLGEISREPQAIQEQVRSDPTLHSETPSRNALSAELRLKHLRNWLDSEQFVLPSVTESTYAPGILTLPEHINPEHERLSVLWKQNLEQYVDKKSGGIYEHNRLIIAGNHGYLGVGYQSDAGKEYTIVYVETLQYPGQENKGLYYTLQAPPLSEREKIQVGDRTLDDSILKIEEQENSENALLAA